MLNAGAWGTALASLLAERHGDVRLWCRRADLAEDIRATRQNERYLPGVSLPANVRVTAELADAVAGVEAVILAPISQAMRTTARALAALVQPGVHVAHAAKGFESESLMRLSEVVAESLGPPFAGRIAALSGPTHAEEVALGQPTAAVMACADGAEAAYFQDLLHGPTLRVYTSPDVAGVEVCGALKNVIALATGGGDGLGYGDNGRAALITRALAEIGRLVHAVGGDPRTVAGLAGLGDVVATCTSRHSRNRWTGEQLGRGRQLDEILASTPKYAEGIPATRAAVRLAERHQVDLPICTQVYRVLYEGAPARQALASLMGREATAEL